jgi:hypothetical protein
MSEEKQSEAQLCTAFRAWCEERGWIVHPEVSSWDLVLTPGPPEAMKGPVGLYDPGLELGAVRNHISFIRGKTDQIGVQAKLHGNVEVLYQAIRGRRCGPAWRLLLVPRATPEFVGLADHLGFMVAVQEDRLELGGFARGRVKWQAVDGGFRILNKPKQFVVSSQLELPPVVTSLIAGGNSPRQLTPWRVKALRMCRLLRERGYVTHDDFKAAGIDRRVWLTNLWLTPDAPHVTVAGRKRGDTRWVAGPGTLPDVGWEQISADLAAKEKEATP